MPDLNLISMALSSITGAKTIVQGLLSLDRALDKAEDKAKPTRQPSCFARYTGLLQAVVLGPTATSVPT
jgi:hypothetical protein